MHVPFTHFSPNAQAAAPPQAHCPLWLHPSARASHAVHAVPADPHCVALRLVTHAMPSQHPFGQLVALHACATHTPALHAPVPQFAHAPPPLPHAAAVFPSVQLVPLQQPLAHVAAEHGGGITQVPASQLPAPQSRQAAPPVPHAVCEVPG